MTRTTIYRLGVAAAALTCASLVSAQNPRLFKSNANPSPAPAASAGEHHGGDKKSENNNGGDDSAFLKAAAAGGMKEVEMGRMAEKNGQSDEVKKIGRQMVSDHTALNKEVMAAAGKRGVKLPSKSDHSMKDMKGADFDNHFLGMMVEDHNKDIRLFENEAKNGHDPEVKAMAQKALPTLKKHLATVKSAQKKTAKAGGSTSAQ